MCEQRNRLLELSLQENVQVLVLPWESGAHAAMKGAFTVVSFDEDDDPDVVYLETLAGGRYVGADSHDPEVSRNLCSCPQSVSDHRGVSEMSTDPTPWIKASASGGSGQCVELRGHNAAVEVRDTKAHGQGPTLRFSSAEFAAWLDGAKKGEFNHLLAD